MLSGIGNACDSKFPVRSDAVNWSVPQFPIVFGSLPAIVHFRSQVAWLGFQVTTAVPVASVSRWLEGEKLPVRTAGVSSAKITRTPGTGSPFGSSTIAVMVNWSVQVVRSDGWMSRRNWLNAADVVSTWTVAVMLPDLAVTVGGLFEVSVSLLIACPLLSVRMVVSAAGSRIPLVVENVISWPGSRAPLLELSVAVSSVVPCPPAGTTTVDGLADTVT